MSEKLNIQDYTAGTTPIISIYDNLLFADKLTYDRLMKAEMDHKPMWRHATDQEVRSYILSSYQLSWKRIKVNMISQNQNQTGYGKLSKQLDKAMNSEQVQKVLHTNEYDIAFIVNSVWSLESGRIVSNIKKNIKKSGANQKIVVFTMWETDTWHPLHVEALQDADCVIVPSEWNKTTLKASGYKGKIEVCNLPMTHGFEYVEREHDQFTFLTYNGGDKRKGFPLYLEAFRNEFTEEDNVHYIVKTTGYGVFPNNIKEYRKENEIDNVTYINTDYSDEQLQELLGKADCFVFPSSGEGWGYTPLEAVTSGLPVILPKQHSFIDHWNDAYIDVKTKKVKAEFQAMDATYIQDDIGKWFESDVKDLQAKMREVYEQWKAKDNTLWELAKIEGSKVLDNYSIESTSQRLTQIITSL